MSKPLQFGKYLLLERIGIGGMAEVFKAKTFGAEGFERLVAIKRILPHLIEDDDFVKMFIDEAKIAVRLQHPNIVGIHDLGRAGGTLYIAMELVPGRDVRALYDVGQERGIRTPIGIACHIVMKMCEALHHAHFATGPRGEPLKVIHRDVSPQNVLLSFDGEVKVADFGLAKARGRMVQTQAGVVKGKLAYMSPEQLRGDEIDHRVDVFGLGIVLFELLAGTRLFLGPSDMDTLRMVYEARVPSMQAIVPGFPADLEAIVRRALAKDRDQRYATALDLHDDLQAFVYAHGCFQGAAALRSHLREVFPDAAPQEAPLPSFAPPPVMTSAPPPPPGPTVRPPSRSQILPPPSMLQGRFDAPLLESAPPPMPPFLDDDVLEGPVTERPPPPEGIGALTDGPVLPDEPAGLYDDWPAVDAPPTDLGPGRPPHVDTRPAPAPDPEDFLAGWEDDGPTLNTPLAAPPPPELDSLWDDDDDQTIVVDPKRNHSP